MAWAKPCQRGEAVDFAGAGAAPLGQHGQQIIAGLDSPTAAGGQHAYDRCDLGSGLFIPDVQPVFATQRHGAPRVVARLGELAAGQNFRPDRHQAHFQRGHFRRALFLPPPVPAPKKAGPAPPPPRAGGTAGCSREREAPSAGPPEVASAPGRGGQRRNAADPWAPGPGRCAGPDRARSRHRLPHAWVQHEDFRGSEARRHRAGRAPGRGTRKPAPGSVAGQPGNGAKLMAPAT